MQRLCLLRVIRASEYPSRQGYLAAHAGLEVQSWLSGWNPLPSSCPPQSMYESLNIRHMYIREAGRGWNTTVDHSKWAITIPETSSRAGDHAGSVHRRHEPHAGAEL